MPKPQIDREAAMNLWISEHSDYAKEQVIINNQGMIGTVLKSLNLNPFDEDLYATGLVGVVKAVNTFNPDKGVKFSAYTTPIIRNEILMTLRKKRIIPAFSLDEPCDLGNGEQVSYADMIVDKVDFEEKVIANMSFNEMVGLLTERENKIIFLRLEGKTQKQIAKTCEITQSQVSRIIKSTCEKFKKKFY